MSRKSNSEIEIEARIDRVLIAAERESSRHIIVDLRAPAHETEGDKTRVPLNLAIVIDASGSMRDERIAAAKR